MRPYFEKGDITLYHGDLLNVLPTLPDNSVDFVVTDPPYLLNFMEKEWDKGGIDIPTNELVFRSWFAGLVAGEGYFRIHRVRNGDYYSCHFGIHMRADEGPLLRALQRRFGFGSIKDEPAVIGKLIESAPSIRWEVISKADCWKLTQILDGTPLYGKKQQEYDLWRRALKVWTDTPKGNRWHGARDNGPMEVLWNEMKTLRPFDQELADGDFDPIRQPDYLFHNRWAKACLRVVKPGGLLLAFGGTRTYHRLTCAIEDAGWEIRDCLMWLYGSGFPKAGDIGKMIDKAKGAKREVVGTKVYAGGHIQNWTEDQGSYHGMAGKGVYCETAPTTDLARQWTGWNNALKPAWEPIVLAMKAMEGTIAHNAETYGVAGMNIDASRISVGDEVIHTPQSDPAKRCGTVGTNLGITQSNREAFQSAQRASIKKTQELGRYPANLLLDEEAADLLDQQTGTLTGGTNCVRSKPGGGYHGGFGKAGDVQITYGDSGGASRFFYCAKAAKKEKGVGNDHPTVKPIALMKYLLTLLSTPTGGTVLDPFAGSGSTLLAAKQLGRRCIGVELDEHNCEIAAGRLQ